MIVESITYTKRKPLEPYAHEEITASALIEEGDVLGQILELKNFVDSALSKNRNEIISFPNSEPVPDKKTPKAEEKVKKPAAKAEAKEEKTTPEKESPAAKEEVVKAEEKKTPLKVKVKGAVTKYNRATELHKKLVSEILDSDHKGWRTNATKARDASVKLEEENIDFLDSEGRVLDSFKEALKMAMEAK